MSNFSHRYLLTVVPTFLPLLIAGLIGAHYGDHAGMAALLIACVASPFFLALGVDVVRYLEAGDNV